jgi:hypothetical protein
MKSSPLLLLFFVTFGIAQADITKEEDWKVTHLVWFDISIGGEEVGRIEMGLFGDILPRKQRRHN